MGYFHRLRDLHGIHHRTHFAVAKTALGQYRYLDRRIVRIRPGNPQRGATDRLVLSEGHQRGIPSQCRLDRPLKCKLGPTGRPFVHFRRLLRYQPGRPVWDSRPKEEIPPTPAGRPPSSFAAASPVGIADGRTASSSYAGFPKPRHPATNKIRTVNQRPLRTVRQTTVAFIAPRPPVNTTVIDS